MEQRKFGKLDFEVSRFGMGCMRLPLENLDDPKSIDEKEAVRMIRHAIDNGVNYIDTAYPYHGRQSEPLVAKALKDGYRERVKLATKLPTWLTNTYEDFEKYLDEQLQRLDTKYIDFYLLHALDKDRWDKIRALNVLEFLEKAKRDGKIKYAGFSSHDELPVFKEIIDSYDWDMCQIQLNILDEDYQAGVEGLRYAGSKGIPVVVMEPLKGGKLAQNISPDVLDIWNESQVTRTPVEWAFRWLYNFPEVALILSGVSTMEQLEDNIRIFENSSPNSMTPEELGLVSRVRKVYDNRIKVGCTGCNYCMPCPSGVSIPEVFSLYNSSSMFNTLDEFSERYKGLFKSGNDASRCVECEKCQEACPQGISIIEKLKAAHRILGSI